MAWCQISLVGRHCRRGGKKTVTRQPMFSPSLNQCLRAFFLSGSGLGARMYYNIFNKISMSLYLKYGFTEVI